MMKIVTIIGARPQFVKAAVVSRALDFFAERHRNKQINEVIVHTGQHYDTNMSDIFFAEMQIPKPHYNLHMGGGYHGVMTGQMLAKIEEILLEEKPDVVLVYGDTNSTIAGALAAVKLHIPVAHVESGLRSFNMRMPEEVNRILTDRISSWLFCPTKKAVNNLQGEGFMRKEMTGKYLIENVGDVMYDAALFYKDIAQPSETLSNVLKEVNYKFYLATIHRAENTDDMVRLKNIIKALECISRNIPVILPLHPRTRNIIQQYNIQLDNIKVIDPVGYFDMITLLEQCQGVLTDSGGVQKEAYFFCKPCITLRDETEWVELVEHGYNVLVGADYDKILQAQKESSAKQLDFSIKLYGDGTAGDKIIQKIVEVVLK
ncbi:non-hydrolyzing UDP-N-acetylglucosamine 2-epimerase [Pelosinus propionicus]|uniref:UDP-GlcNAc3NAcA epimerase n=1 Tax=Pelosinus propionicus DSM 13327 TaxID=1123291 RepID=A0A1I4MP39_9FIRM|nr:UDP-N-acetylglucosamine 2-epimerase (non-hydrolyzing) [Pelosinus propionicus]SFM05034.1 UDP-GlcNAc3NAcA epimerase [Pelosinus propionicus DSM 13327]